MKDALLPKFSLSLLVRFELTGLERSGGERCGLQFAGFGCGV